MVDKALAEFNEALRLNPQSHDAKTGLSSTLLLNGEIDKAVEILNEALRVNPHPQMTYYKLGIAYEMKGETAQAVKMYRKALEGIMKNVVLPSAVSR